MAAAQESDWKLEQCDFVGGSAKVPMPSLKYLTRKISDAGSLKFKPEACGGYTRSLDVSTLVDHQAGLVDLSYTVKELCGQENLATELQCDVEFSGKAWNVKGCVLAEDGDTEE